jgi:nickel-dependent lactate racemase
LKYGKQVLKFEMPSQATPLRAREPIFSLDKESFTHQLLKKLPEDKDPYLNVGIVLADKTRLCGYPLYLPWLLEVLHQKGAKKENITFYIAYGTHPEQTEKESLDSYGDVYKEYNFIHHNCIDKEALIELGTTSRGTPVKVRRDTIASRLLITFGAITHHYFAGFGGGRKLLMPGLADRDSIYKNHSLFLDRENRALAKGCQPGNLEGNPVAEDLKEIDGMMPEKISIHGLLNSKGEVVDLLVGDSYADFEEACGIHDSYYRSGLNESYDLVVASTGGYPKDINFIQAHKSIHNAAAFVKTGGRLIILSECIDSIASNYFLQYFEKGSFNKAFDILAETYQGNGCTALSMMSKTSRIHITMMTELDNALCKLLNVTKADQKMVQDILNEETGSVAVIDNASLLLR